MAKSKNLTYAPAYETYWQAQPVDADAIVASSGASVLGCNRVNLHYTRITPTGTREDRAIFGLWVAKITGGGLYSKHSVSELATLETALDTFATAIATFQTTNWTLVEYQWFQVDQNSPRDESGKSQLLGPPAKITSKAVVGIDGTATLPFQVASTITLRTVSRRHWGRSYIPGLSSARLQASYGRWTNTLVDGLANAMNTLHDSWVTAGSQLGTWSLLKPAFMTPKTIEVDDVPDIIRRRRAKQMAYRKLLS